MAHADIVNEWFRERLSGGPIARNTEAYNQLVAALPALIARLDGVVEPIAAADTADAPQEPAPSKPAKGGAKSAPAPDGD